MALRRARRNDHSGSHGRERWLVSYADFVTLLLAFFVTMYAITQLDKEKIAEAQHSINKALSSPMGGSTMGSAISANPITGASGDVVGATLVAPPVPTQMEEVNKTVQQDLKESLEKEELRLLHTAKGLVLRLPEFSFFDSGQAQVRPEAIPLLYKLSAILNTIPNTILIEGHTDNRPIRTAQFPSNWELSTARAAALVRYFVEDQHLDPARFAAAGYGEFQPLADNSDDKGRQANRRVDLIIQPMKRIEKPKGARAAAPKGIPGGN